MAQPWADQPFALIPTSKTTKAVASKEVLEVADGSKTPHQMYYILIQLMTIMLSGKHSQHDTARTQFHIPASSVRKGRRRSP